MINTLPVPAPGDCRFSGEKLYAAKLVCASSAYAATADLVSLGLSGVGAAGLRVTEDPSMGESYAITIGEGYIDIRGGPGGVYSGFSILAALSETDERGSYFPQGSIAGKPKYGYRGVMLDVARHFHPLEEVKRLLDIMFRLRLNKFHWHIADDQGFRIDLKQYPRLREIASRRASTACGGYIRNRGDDGAPHSGCYSEEEVREILAYAAIRGIEVIPELDMPGHMSALIAAYPELSCNGQAIEVPGHFGILRNVLCIGNDRALEFMEGLVAGLCDLFGARTFHIGFDEVKLDQLKTCPQCQARMQALGLTRVEELKTYAKNRIRDTLKQRGVRVVMYNDGMEAADPEVICYYWFMLGKRRKDSVLWINQGQPAIMAPLGGFYLDHPYVLSPLKKTYTLNPVFPGVTRPEHILGLEAPLWTEHVADHGKIAFNAYYRMAALAEIAWHGEARRPYGDFMQALRAREEYYFGERLDIPQEVLDPGLGRKISLLGKCLLDDMNAEYTRFQSARELLHPVG
ncbi:MAG: family 20 glycosylhydrolase, partial [Treponema sp.]|jgi:hexosaminidase|nr:family 20 glycosylhydrolase [Treponema sp.]